MTPNPCTPKRYEPTTIEKATEQVMRDLNVCVTTAYFRFNVRDQIGGEEKFRAILAAYFEQKVLRDWCSDLGIEPLEPKA